MKNKKKAIGKPQRSRNATAASQAASTKTKSPLSYESWGPSFALSTPLLWSTPYEIIAKQSNVVLLRSLGTEPPHIGRYVVEANRCLVNATHDPFKAWSSYVLETLLEFNTNFKLNLHFKDGVAPGEYAKIGEDDEWAFNVPPSNHGMALLAKLAALASEYEKLLGTTEA